MKSLQLLIPRSISFVIVSVGSIILSITVASLMVMSSNPTGLNLTIKGYFLGIGHTKQPSLVSVNGNRTEVLNNPQDSEKDQDLAFAPKSSVDGVKNGLLFAPTISFDKSNSLAISPELYVDEVSNSSAFAPSLSFDEMPNNLAFAPTLSGDELQNVENASTSVSINVGDSKEPDLFIEDSEKNISEISSDNVASLNQTASAAAEALPSPPTKDYDEAKLRNCDLLHGKWIYDHTGPLYTNNTCPILAEAQNCQGNGRPDKNYENWRWKPNQCEFPRFDGRKFLELMRGKTLAFVGDSLARNQMESLLCILWQTEVPVNHGNRQMHRWHFQSTSTTIIRIWSAWLVRTTPLPHPSPSPRAVQIHLDTPDETFLQFLPSFDVLLLSSGHWFTKESVYLHNKNNTSRTKRSRRKQKRFDIFAFYTTAIETALTAITKSPNYKGLTIFRSYSPEHYVGGSWNTGGSCVGIDTPADKSMRSGRTNVMLKKQSELIERAKKRVRNGSRLRFVDITEMSGYRRDGHPSRYSRKGGRRVESGAEDCVHWCMPGPFDMWNEVLFEILKREI